MDLMDRYKAACGFRQPVNDAGVSTELTDWLQRCGYKGRLTVKRLDDWTSAASAARAAWDASAASAARAAWDASAARAASAARDARAASAASAARAAWDAAWTACIVFGAIENNDETTASIWQPTLHALEHGAWIIWLTDNTAFWIPVPVIKTDERNRPHCSTDAAFKSLDLEEWFWHGVIVPARAIHSPLTLKVSEIESEQNAEIRRVLIERYGQGRYLLESGAKKIHSDDWGTLYRKEIPDDEPLVMVKVVNSTPEPDGSGHKDYFLRVPPNIERARQAVAWTFGREEKSYAPTVQT